MNHYPFPSDPACADRARRALEHFRSMNGFGGTRLEELIAAFFADLAHLAAQEGVNYGALVGYAQVRWTHATCNAPPGKEHLPPSD